MYRTYIKGAAVKKILFVLVEYEMLNNLHYLNTRHFSKFAKKTGSTIVKLNLFRLEKKTQLYAK